MHAQLLRQVVFWLCKQLRVNAGGLLVQVCSLRSHANHAPPIAQGSHSAAGVGAMAVLLNTEGYSSKHSGGGETQLGQSELGATGLVAAEVAVQRKGAQDKRCIPTSCTAKTPD
jgi:hypothetical protein